MEELLVRLKRLKEELEFYTTKVPAVAEHFAEISLIINLIEQEQVDAKKMEFVSMVAEDAIKDARETIKDFPRVVVKE